MTQPHSPSPQDSWAAQASYAARPPVFTSGAVPRPDGRGWTAAGSPRRGPSTRWVVGGLIAVLAVIAVAALVVWLVLRPSADERAIQAAYDAFEVGMMRSDGPAMAANACAAEKWHYPDDLKYPWGTVDGPSYSKLSDITVKADVASGRNAQGKVHALEYFRKEDGSWKVCDSAKADFDASH